MSNILPFSDGIFHIHHNAPFIYKDISFSNLAQYLMYCRAATFQDEDSIIEILKCNSALQVIEIGRMIKGFDTGIWKQYREVALYNGNLMKFEQNENLANELLETKGKILALASYDRILGLGLSHEDKRIDNVSEWNGLNLLGIALMKVRSKIYYEHLHNKSLLMLSQLQIGLERNHEKF